MDIDATIKKKSSTRKLPFGEAWNQAAWKEAVKRAKASLPPYCAAGDGLIDMDAPAFTPLSCEVDHKVPISRGGAPYDLDNLQLMHTRCNRKKGAKMASDYDGLQVANPFPLSNNW